MALKCKLYAYYIYKCYISRFNLPSDLVPLMGLYKLIPIGKISLFIEKKPIFKWTKNL